MHLVYIVPNLLEILDFLCFKKLINQYYFLLMVIQLLSCKLVCNKVDMLALVLAIDSNKLVE